MPRCGSIVWHQRRQAAASTASNLLSRHPLQAVLPVRHLHRTESNEHVRQLHSHSSGHHRGHPEAGAAQCRGSTARGSTAVGSVMPRTVHQLVLRPASNDGRAGNDHCHRERKLQQPDSVKMLLLTSLLRAWPSPGDHPLVQELRPLPAAAEALAEGRPG